MSAVDTAVSPWEGVLERASLDPRRADFDAFELLTNTMVGVAKSSPQAASRLGDWLSGDQVVGAYVELAQKTAESVITYSGATSL